MLIISNNSRQKKNMTENKCNKSGLVWRESASLIICVKNPKTSDDFDYELLMIKRSNHTAVAQNQVVFPGGIFDHSDESIEWLKYFHDFGVTEPSLKELVVVDNEIERPRIFVSQGTGCYDRFFKNSTIWAREISIRINAIRETFEEVGILMCRTRDQLYSQSTEGFCLKNFDKTKWQKAVHDDPSSFLSMCKELQVVPDLWGLYEWCCWASPAVLLKGFETAFYITFLNEKPDVICEKSEAAEHLWNSPSALLRMVKNMEVFVLPPQFYEISRFVPYKSYEYLKTFAKERSGKGTIMIQPISYFCTDGVVSVLPGDDYYSGCPRLATEYRNLDFSSEEFRLRSKRIHRLENGIAPNATLYLNFEPLDDGHLIPFCGRDEKHKL